MTEAWQVPKSNSFSSFNLTNTYRTWLPPQTLSSPTDEDTHTTYMCSQYITFEVEIDLFCVDFGILRIVFNWTLCTEITPVMPLANHTNYKNQITWTPTLNHDAILTITRVSFHSHLPFFIFYVSKLNLINIALFNLVFSFLVFLQRQKGRSSTVNIWKDM